MAGNKMTTKNKGKEDRSKGGKVVPQTGEDNEDPDFTILRKPVMTSITGFAQARKIFDVATEELKDLLTNECDLLYECKVCRNIFRSLVNFISHKRIYCQEKFNSSVHGHFIDPVSTVNEILKINRSEREYQASLRNKNVKTTEDEEDDRIPLSKDLTEVVERIAKVKGSSGNEEQNVALQKIPTSSVAVFQNLCTQEKDTMRSQVSELEDILSRDKAVLQSDGKFCVVRGEGSEGAEHVIQISDDEDGEEGAVLKCRICGLQFSTQKTLKFHMKSKHVESRLVFPCPDCLEIFSTSWSVYRHLFKVHRKTAAQIRRLRESIQAKAFRMNNPPAAYERRRRPAPPPAATLTADSHEHENQAWMENLEGAGEGACCGGCGRAFPRRAALAAHTATCPRRSAALAAPPRPPHPPHPPHPPFRDRADRRGDVHIRKDYNKASPGVSILKNDVSTEAKPSEEVGQPEDKKEQETDDKDVKDEKDPLEDAPMDIEEEQSNDSADSPEKNESNAAEDIRPAFRLPFAMQAEKSNLAAFKQRVHPDIELAKLHCKKCDTTHPSLTELYKHMAEHYKWIRYACKLCNFKHYNFDNLPEHVKVVHKLKGDSDFYFSTVKAIDGTEAMILSRCLVEAENADENNEPSETSPESRRPSRCSSDSSRLSDDSSSSSNVKDTGSRKRKMYQAKTVAKRKKESNNAETEEEPKEGTVSLAKVLKSIIGGKESPSPIKGFEENSSDMDDIEEKITRKVIMPLASKRPVRKRTKPKNEDFEYDLSNLLKLEAQGYRESRPEVAPSKPAQPTPSKPAQPTPSKPAQATPSKPAQPTPSKPAQPKKKVQPENIHKDCNGALVLLSKKAVEMSTAHLKTNFPLVMRPTNVFARPLPKILQRGDKVYSRKEIEIVKDDSSPNKEPKSKDNVPTPTPPVIKDVQSTNVSVEEATKRIEIVNVKSLLNEYVTNSNEEKPETTPEANVPVSNTNVETDKNDINSISEDKVRSNKNISAVVPVKFRRQSLDLIKNPIINKNISDFNKAGMKTKILVIKPINRSKDGNSTSTSMKFQTIKLKEPSCLGLNNDDNKQSDQVVVVKVPKVDCAIPRTVSETQVTDCEKITETKDKNESSSVSEPVVVHIKSENELIDNKSYRVEQLQEAVSDADEILEAVSNTKEMVEAVSNADEILEEIRERNEVSSEKEVKNEVEELSPLPNEVGNGEVIETA